MQLQKSYIFCKIIARSPSHDRFQFDDLCTILHATSNSKKLLSLLKNSEYTGIVYSEEIQETVYANAVLDGDSVYGKLQIIKFTLLKSPPKPNTKDAHIYDCLKNLIDYIVDNTQFIPVKNQGGVLKRIRVADRYLTKTNGGVLRLAFLQLSHTDQFYLQ